MNINVGKSLGGRGKVKKGVLGPLLLVSMIPVVLFLAHFDHWFQMHDTIPTLLCLQLKKLEESLDESKQKLEESQEQLKTNENGEHPYVRVLLIGVIQLI